VNPSDWLDTEDGRNPVERAAEAAYESHNGDFAFPADDWATASVFAKASKRQEARAALRVLLAPASQPPVLVPMSEVERVYLGRALSDISEEER
jgi:hypothetical protein